MMLALAGDTMLGRGVTWRLAEDPNHELFAPELVAVVPEADLFVLNLECCISARGQPTPGRVFHFRAPPWALARLGVDCVTLANNHALDFGPDALLDSASSRTRASRPGGCSLDRAPLPRRVRGAGPAGDRARRPP